MPKISDLTAATSVGATDVIPIVQSGTTKKLTASTLTGYGKTAAETSAGVTVNVAYPVGDVRRYGAVGDGTTDDTAAIQAALDAVGAVTAGEFQAIAAKGQTVFVPPGEYLITATLSVPSNVILKGTGFGSKFKFNPSSANSDFVQRKNANVGGSALNRSNFSMRFEDFYVYAAYTGSTTTGRGGGTIATPTNKARHCFSLSDCAFSSFKNVMVTDFWYGTAFNLQLGSLFAYYNSLVGCVTRDCKLSVQTTSACHITDCYFTHGVAFPPPAIQADVDYVISFDGYRGCAMHGGSIEASCATALIKNNGAGHSITGVYMEAFGDTPAMMDCSALSADSGSLLMGGNSYGFTLNTLYEENVARTGDSVFMLGSAMNFGDCDEMEIEHVSTRQSPSFREGLPGAAQYPAGGTMATSTSSFIGNTSIELTRGAGTAATTNQMSYNFKIRSSNKVTANVWVTALVYPVGEDNFDIRTYDATNSTVNFAKVMTFNNGWQLWAGYLKRVDNDTITFYARQLTGSTDSARKLRVTALRCYTNGFLPIPAAYKFPEYQSAAPTTGTWVRGDIVWNAEPSSGGAPGWVCTTGGSPGTWKAMANLA